MISYIMDLNLRSLFMSRGVTSDRDMVDKANKMLVYIHAREKASGNDEDLLIKYFDKYWWV